MDSLAEEHPQKPVKRTLIIWKKRTLLEYCLIAICVILLIVSIVTLVLLLRRQSAHDNVNPKTVCDNPNCKYVAGSILTNMDFTIDPCKNFYEFSCGSYLKYENAYEDNINRYSNLFNYMLYLAKEQLEKPSSLDIPSFIRKVQTYYESCLNRSRDVEQVVKKFLNISHLPGWPISRRDPMRFTMEDAAALTIIYQNTGVLFDVTYFSSNSSLHISKGFVTIDSIYLANDLKIKERYIDMMNYLFLELNLSLDISYNYTEEIMEFESSLAKIKQKNRTDSVNSTISKLTRVCPEIKWRRLFQLWNDTLGDSSSKNGYILTIESIGYIKDLCQLINKTEKRVIYNLLVWNMLIPVLVRFDSTFRGRLQYIFSETNFDPNEMWGNVPDNNKSKWRVCILDMSDLIKLVMEYMTIKSIRPEEDIKQIKRYAKEISDMLNEIFSEEKWIDDYSRNIAESMVNNITYYIGYPNVTVNEEILSEFFRNITITNNYMENIFLIRKKMASINYLNSKARKEITSRTFFHPFYANPYYDPETLYIVLQLGNMFPPFYAPHVPQYYNYAGTGFSFGHEVSHAFDSLENSSDNSSNNGQKEIHWPEKFLKEYQRRQTCLIDQYYKFPLEGNITVNGTYTITENFADNSGIYLAFRAYEKYLSQHEEEPRLPGLDFTNRQMFFIVYAQGWCEKINPKFYNSIYETNVHSPAKYRVFGPLMNSPDFSKAFKCPLNSYMNPEHKCKVWN